MADESFKIICMFAASLNGRTTKGDNPDVHAWTSDEDSMQFRQAIKDSEVIIVGRKTYEVMNLQPEPGKLRIVLTGDVAKYADKYVEGQMEFTGESPGQIKERLQNAGYHKVLLAAGSQVSSLFLAAGLIDELHVTIEPVVFGSGNFLFEGEDIDAKLHLISVERLNEQGSLLARYRVQ